MAYRLGELAGILRCRLRGDPERVVNGVQTLEAAGDEHLSFLTNPRYRRQAAESCAGALLVPEGLELPGRDLLSSKEPYVVLAQALELFHPRAKKETGIHPSAVVERDALVHPSAWIGAGTFVDNGAVVEERAQIHAQVSVGRGCRVGKDSILYPQVVLYPETSIGERCIVHSGAVLGSDGFGFATGGGQHVKIPQVGRVVIEDDVEIGANTTVDRGTLGETRVGAGTKIDNLVQLGHNVKVGRGCLLISQAGIAGSTRLGDFVVLAGQSGVGGHLRLGDGVQVAGGAAVMQSVAEGQVAGMPAIPAGKWRRQVAMLKRLEGLHRRLAALEKDRPKEGSEDE